MRANSWYRANEAAFHRHGARSSAYLPLGGWAYRGTPAQCLRTLATGSASGPGVGPLRWPRAAVGQPDRTPADMGRSRRVEVPEWASVAARRPRLTCWSTLLVPTGLMASSMFEAKGRPGCSPTTGAHRLVHQGPRPGSRRHSPRWGHRSPARVLLPGMDRMVACRRSSWFLVRPTCTSTGVVGGSADEGSAERRSNMAPSKSRVGRHHTGSAADGLPVAADQRTTGAQRPAVGVRRPASSAPRVANDGVLCQRSATAPSE